MGSRYRLIEWDIMAQPWRYRLLWDLKPVKLMFLTKWTRYQPAQFICAAGKMSMKQGHICHTLW